MLILASGMDYALHQATGPGLFVVVVLLLLSSFSWAVMITKYQMLRRVRRTTEAFLAAFRNAVNPLQLDAAGEQFETAPAFRIYREASQALAARLPGAGSAADAPFPEPAAAAGKLTAAELEAVQLVMQRVVGEEALRLEAQTALLATAVSGGPFLGLLGTVWGVMDTFSAIAASNSAASIKEMAPGVAAALVTTVIGLLVAIPAMFGYNYLVARIRRTIVGMDNFAAELAERFNRCWLETRPIPENPALRAPRPAVQSSSHEQVADLEIGNA